MLKNRNKEQGQVIIIAVVFGAILLSMSGALVGLINTYVKTERHNISSIQALQIAEAGMDQAVYQLNQSGSYTGETNTALGAGVFTTTVATINSATKRITSTGYIPNSVSPTAVRTVKATVNINLSIVAFRYGVQVGNGGLVMGNGSQVNGNVYSNSSITGGGTITSDATVAGANSLGGGVTVGGIARAHTLSNCHVTGDAYYQSISSCPVGGTTHPGSADSAAQTMPITDQQVTDWEATAAAGGVISGNYIASGTQTIGPKEINGDLTVTGTLYLSGPVWVNGNVTFGNNTSLIVALSTGTNGAILIADAIGNTAAKGIVTLSNNMTIAGNGNAGSFPMILSTNTGNTAITLSNNASSVILYAGYGGITVSNNAQANELSANKIILSNNATIDYVSGLQSQGFSNGPGGAWTIVSGSYVITK